MLYVFDYKTDGLLTVLSNESNEQLKYWNAEVNEQLGKDFTMQFITLADHEDSHHVKEGNLVAYKDLDGKFQLFQIFRIEEYRTDSQGSIHKQVFCEHNYYELIDDIIEDSRMTDQDITIAVDKALANSRWKRGNVATLGIGTLNFYYSSALQNLRDITDVYGGELSFRIEFNDRGITGRFVDVVARRGADTGRRFEYTKDMTNIQRTVDANSIKTALYGRGAAEQLDSGGYSRKTTFKDVSWSVANGDPTDKPLGQEYVGDPNALSEWGKENGTRHRVGTVDIETTDPAKLLKLTWEVLQEMKKPKVSYEITVMDLETISGYDHMKVRLGDTVVIIDRGFNPQIVVEARVVEIKRNIDDPTNTEIKIGNFLPLLTDATAKIEIIDQKFKDKENIWDKATTVTDGSFPNTTPNVPANPKAQGLFENIAVKWDYEPSSYIASYEVYASQLLGFTPDSTNLVYRGKSGGYVHQAQPNQTWYFRMRAVNHAGTVSGFTAEVTGSTANINDANWIADATIGNAKIKDLSADKINVGTLDGSIVNVVKLNADNIVAGKVKAQFLEINGQATFSAGYDPTHKETIKPIAKADFKDGTVAGKGFTFVNTGGHSFTNEGNLKIIGNTTDPYIVWDIADFNGGHYEKVAIRVRYIGASPSTATPAWDGKIFYETPTRAFSGTYIYQLPEPTRDGSWVTLVADMHKLDWKTNTITKVRFDLWNYADFEIQFVAVGTFSGAITNQADIDTTIAPTKDTVNAWRGTADQTLINGGKIEAKSIKTEQLSVTAKDLINNPTKTGTLDEWTNLTNGGNVYLGTTTIKGSTTAVIQESSGDAIVTTNFFEVDPQKAYKMFVSLYQDGTAGTRYFGVELYDKNMTQITPKKFNIADRTISNGSGVWDGYFWHDKGTTSFRDMEGYLVPNSTTTFPTGKNVDRHIIMPEATKYVRVKLLNHYNNGTLTKSWWWSPTVIEADAGIISFDQATGGTLTIGGQNNKHGVIRIMDGNGNETGTISGDTGGFSELSIDRIKNTQNIIFKTTDQTNTVVHVDGYNGSDATGDGTLSKPFATIQFAVDSLPKYLERNITIRVSSGVYLEDVFIEGFSGSGRIILETHTPRAYYVRFYQNGSSANTGNHMVEIEAWNKGGTNVASGKYTYLSASGTSVLGLTDGNKDSAAYVSNGSGSLQFYQVNLGGLHDLRGIKAWGYYADNRTYRQTKAMVSDDGTNFRTIFDSAVEGEYMEIAAGKDLTKARIVGGLNVRNNSTEVSVYDIDVSLQSGSTKNVVTVENQIFSIFDRCRVTGNKNNVYSFRCFPAAFVRILNTEVNKAKHSGIIAAYNSKIEVTNCTGGDQPYGLNSFAASHIGGSGKAPVGTTANTQSNYNGAFMATWTHENGEYTYATNPTTQVKETWTSHSQNAWRSYDSIWLNDGIAAQGQWDNWGLYRGYYFFDSNLSSTLTATNVKSIDKIRVYLTRASSAGYSSGVTHYIRTHGYTTQPSGTAQPDIHTDDYVTVSLAHGGSAWVELPASMLTKFKNGTAKGFGLYTSNTSNTLYSKMTGVGKIEVTYTKQ